ncbi:preprotein translocase subunit SecG [Acholeplasma morum]|jgi:preprotein translocase subunit SecG|uniref:preprotein translocase subunit SecG n=1 Tax=Paracholeplasma morum TaxID=264637 RepID=UPI0019572ED3|nr:preprotein translocase subunit SecG [Paracholeplasma morum]MBM7452764.1 preprotein translocase subunit SecG [Paracholeplasma morum]
MNFADYIVLVLGLFLIVSVALQSSQDNVASAFSGEKSELFKNSKARGVELFLMRFTAITSILFVAMIVVSILTH